MFITLNDKKDAVVLTDLTAKSEKRKEIENLNSIYSTPNFEYGYLQHGQIWWHVEKPRERVVVTENEIQVHDTHTWGEAPKNGRYPINHYTTKAKNTLIIVREILGLVDGGTVSLKNFFPNNSKEVKTFGFVDTGKFDLELQVKKLEHLLTNPEITLSLLKDAYLDFYLFVDLLTKVDINISKINNPYLFESRYQEATENTKILTLAKEFAKLKQK